MSFRSKAPSNRIQEAQQVVSLLPRCPVTLRKDIGTGEIVEHDYANPSYSLTRIDVMKLLGNPSSTTSDSYQYSIGDRDSNKTFLQIRFQNGLAVESGVYTVAE